MEKVNTLAALKRHFKNGHGVVLTKYLYHGQPCEHKMLGIERHPDIVQTNSVCLNGSWMDYGKASQWTFDAENGKAVYDCGFAVLHYQLIP